MSEKLSEKIKYRLREYDEKTLEPSKRKCDKCGTLLPGKAGRIKLYIKKTKENIDKYGERFLDNKFNMSLLCDNCKKPEVDLKEIEDKINKDLRERHLFPHYPREVKFEERRPYTRNPNSPSMLPFKQWRALIEKPYNLKTVIIYPKYIKNEKQKEVYKMIYIFRKKIGEYRLKNDYVDIKLKMRYLQRRQNHFKRLLKKFLEEN